MKNTQSDCPDLPRKGQDATKVEIAADRLFTSLEAIAANIQHAFRSAGEYMAEGMTEKCSDPLCILPACSCVSGHGRLARMIVKLLEDHGATFVHELAEILSGHTYLLLSAARIKDGRVPAPEIRTVETHTAAGMVLTQDQLKNLFGKKG